MATLEIKLPDQTAARLQEAAQKLGVSPAELLCISLEEKLVQLNVDFQAAARYVLAKNRELYQRLA